MISVQRHEVVALRGTLAHLRRAEPERPGEMVEGGIGVSGERPKLAALKCPCHRSGSPVRLAGLCPDRRQSVFGSVATASLSVSGGT